jgi:hypothetical protein
MTRIRRFPVCAATLILLIGLLPLAGAGRGREAGNHSSDGSLFSTEEYLAHIGYLASDQLEGRGTGQEGNDKAADYIASIFQQYGLRPAGDDETYFEGFTIRLKNQIAAGTRLTFGTQGRTNRRRLTLSQDFVPLPFSASGEFSGQVVFAGYGIVDQESGYDDYGELDVTGKVVLLLRGGPRFAHFAADEQLLLRAKASKANARDAVALIMVNSTLTPAPPGADNGQPPAPPEDKLYDFDSAAPQIAEPAWPDYGLPMLQVTRQVADKMLAAAGMPELAALEKQIEDGRRPVSAALKGVSVKGRVHIERAETPARNVLGLIPGTGPNADEIIVLGAHYDHMGVMHKGEPDFDPQKHIWNGADDNASGTSMLMTLARAYTQGARPNRSILLIAFTAEELGLFGSEYFVNHPTVDLSKCVAMLDFDMVGRLHHDRVEIGGMRTGGFEDAVMRLAKVYGLKVNDGGGGVGPSDHTGFYSKHVPVMFFFTGLHPQYHQPTDDVGLINAEGAMRIAKLAADCIDEIDERAAGPQFQEDTRGFTLDVQGEGEEQEKAVAEPPKDQTAAPPDRPGQTASPGRVRLGVFIGAESGSGVRVRRVIDDSPAAGAGLKPRDIIVQVGEKKLETGEDLIGALAGFKDGDKTEVVVERRGQTLKLEVEFTPAGAASSEALQQAQSALRAVGEHLSKSAGKAGKERTVTWQETAGRTAIIVRSTHRGEVAGFLDKVAEVFGQLPSREKITVQITLRFGVESSGKSWLEASVAVQEAKAGHDAQKKQGSPDRAGGKNKKRAGTRTSYADDASPGPVRLAA